MDSVQNYLRYFIHNGHTCIYVRVPVYVYFCLCVHVSVFVCVYLCVCICVWACACVGLCTPGLYVLVSKSEEPNPKYANNLPIFYTFIGCLVIGLKIVYCWLVSYMIVCIMIKTVCICEGGGERMKDWLCFKYVSNVLWLVVIPLVIQLFTNWLNYPVI